MSPWSKTEGSQQGGIFDLGPAGGPNPVADAETAAMRVRLAVVEAEVKNLRSKMQADGIGMAGIKCAWLEPKTE
jgi:hypothetical protein